MILNNLFSYEITASLHQYQPFPDYFSVKVTITNSYFPAIYSQQIFVLQYLHIMLTLFTEFTEFLIIDCPRFEYMFLKQTLQIAQK